MASVLSDQLLKVSIGLLLTMDSIFLRLIKHHLSSLLHVLAHVLPCLEKLNQSEFFLIDRSTSPYYTTSLGVSEKVDLM